MPIKVTRVLHTGLRIGPKDGDVDKALKFYGGLLGLEVDKDRPHIPGIPGLWMNINTGSRDQQLHIFGAEGQSPVARSPQQDPTRFHVALVVESLEAAKRELERQGVKYWIFESLVGRGSAQVFFDDPFGNMIELQQEGADAQQKVAAE